MEWNFTKLSDNELEARLVDKENELDKKLIKLVKDTEIKELTKEIQALEYEKEKRKGTNV